MNWPAEVEADCCELVKVIDRQAVMAFLGEKTDPAEVDEIAKRLIARGFPVSVFVREVMARRFGYDPKTKTHTDTGAESMPEVVQPREE